MILREKDQLTRNFIELLLVSNYMGGCRLHYNFDPTERPQTPVDTTLTALLPIMESKQGLPRTGITANLLSPGLRQAIESNKVAWIDITDFVNLLTRQSHYFIRSQELQQTVLTLMSTAGFSDRYKVVPSRLALGIPESKFKSSEGVITWQRNISTEHGLSGREVIIRESGRYSHFLWGTRHEVLLPDESDLDHYECSNINEHDKLRVRMEAKLGFLMLTEFHSSDPLQVLSQSVLQAHTINLYMTGRLTHDQWFMERMQTKSMAQFDTSVMIDYYQAATEQVLDEPAPEALDDAEFDLLAMEEESESDSDDGVNMGDIYDDLDEMDLADLAAPSLSSDSDSSSEGEQSAPVSSQSSLRQPEGVLISVLSSAVSSIPVMQIKKAERHFGQRIHEGLMISLPIDLGIKRVMDTSDCSAIRQLYDMVSELDDLDRAWVEDALDQCFLKMHAVQDELKSGRRDWSKEEEDDDDDF